MRTEVCFESVIAHSTGGEGVEGVVVGTLTRKYGNGDDLFYAIVNRAIYVSHVSNKNHHQSLLPSTSTRGKQNLNLSQI